MSIEALLSPLSDESRSFLGRVGRRFGTQEVRAQAKLTLEAHGRFAPELRLHGFSPDDAARLARARLAAVSLARIDTKVTDRNYIEALGEAKNSRARARSVLLSAYRRLRSSGASPELAHAMTQITAIVSSTAEPGGDERVYEVHLTRLREVLAIPTVAAAVANSGGPEADAKLVEGLEALRRVSEASPPASSRDEDVLDGLIVELCRTAQFAAQSAAKEIGNRSLASEFRLLKLSRFG